MMYRHKEALIPPHDAQRHGRGCFTPAAGFHDSGADGANEDRGERGAAPGLRLRAARRGDG